MGAPIEGRRSLVGIVLEAVSAVAMVIREIFFLMLTSEVTEGGPLELSSGQNSNRDNERRGGGKRKGC